MRRKSDLPFGSKFSPSQIDLAHVPELAERHGGDWRAFENAVRSAKILKPVLGASITPTAWT